MVVKPDLQRVSDERCQSSRAASRTQMTKYRCGGCPYQVKEFNCGNWRRSNQSRPNYTPGKPHQEVIPSRTKNEKQHSTQSLTPPCPAPTRRRAPHQCYIRRVQPVMGEKAYEKRAQKRRCEKETCGGCGGEWGVRTRSIVSLHGGGGEGWRISE